MNVKDKQVEWVKIELNGGQFVGGRIKGSDLICCWLTP
jgi:hypothetical protein